MDIETQHAVHRAAERLRRSGAYKVHLHGERCTRMLGDVMTEGEETLMEVRQSYFRSLSPDRVVLTNKRIIIARPSFWGLYLGFNLFTATDISIVPYHHVISIVVTKGKWFSSLHMRIHGFTDAMTSAAISQEGEIDGLKIISATRLALFVQDVIEGIEEDHNTRAIISNMPQHNEQDLRREVAVRQEAMLRHEVSIPAGDDRPVVQGTATR